MQVTETLSAGLKREYKVVVGQAELSTELNAKLADMSKRANIKGFRPGKVPVPKLQTPPNARQVPPSAHRNQLTDGPAVPNAGGEPGCNRQTCGPAAVCRG